MVEMIVGVDPHKASNTIAVLDRDETLHGRYRFENTAEGLVAMLDAVGEFADRVWAVEGANGIGRSVAQRLVAAGETVVDVPAKLATRVRVYSTGHGAKTDETDAVAIATAAVHSKRLRLVRADDENVALKLLSDRRHQLIASRTQSICRLHRLIRELIPGGTPRALTAERAEALVNGLNVTDPAGLMRIELARDHIDDIKRFDRRIDQVTLKIHTAVTNSGTTLTRIYGVGPVTAGLILGEVGDVTRFATRNHFASYTGTAPIAVSSGDINRHRLNRSGNRQLNHAVHIAAIAQIRYDTPGRGYYRRKLAEGKSKREALRCLKRRISDAVYRQLLTDRQLDQHQDPTWPRWPSSRGGHPSYRSPDTLRRNGQPMKPRTSPV
ncbi:MAG: IS110 family transposase [Acidimicrobiia bacterium]|nr:IS110 family transposase [Acidimicrobiia bacterium]